MACLYALAGVLFSSFLTCAVAQNPSATASGLPSSTPSPSPSPSATPSSAASNGLLVSLVINSIVMVLVVTWWQCTRAAFPHVAFPRWLSAGPGAEPQTPMGEYLSSDLTTVPALLRAPPAGLLRFLWHIATYPEAEVLACAGLDAYMLLQLCRTAAAFFFLAALLYGLLVLVPIDVLASTPAAAGASTGLDMLSISHVQPGSTALWAQVRVCACACMQVRTNVRLGCLVDEMRLTLLLSHPTYALCMQSMGVYVISFGLIVALWYGYQR